MSGAIVDRFQIDPFRSEGSRLGHSFRPEPAWGVVSRGVPDGSLFAESRAGRVAGTLPGAIVPTVKPAAVMTEFVGLGMVQRTIDTVVAGLPPTILPFDVDQAAEVARMRTRTRNLGPSLGDRACSALAIPRGVPALSARVTLRTIVGSEMLR